MWWYGWCLEADVQCHVYVIKNYLESKLWDGKNELYIICCLDEEM